MDMQQKIWSIKSRIFTEKYNSASLENFTIASNVTAESKSLYVASYHHPYRCTISEGVNGCANSEGENTYDSAHITSEGKTRTIT